MNDIQGKALDEFLARPPTLEAFHKLNSLLDFYHVAGLALHLTGNDRYRCISALDHALTLDEVGNQFVVEPIASLFGPGDARETDDPRHKTASTILEFCKSVAAMDGAEADSTHSILKDLLVGILQLFAVVGIVRSAAGLPQLSESQLVIQRDFVSSVVLPLFDTEETLLSELVTRAILSSAEGRVVRLHTSPSVILTSWNITDDKVLKAARDSCRHWRIRRLHLYTTGEGAPGSIEPSPAVNRKSPGTTEGTGASPVNAGDTAAEDAATRWLFDSGFLDAIESRLKGTAELKVSPNNRAAHKDVVRVRAASLLIRLTDLSSLLASRSHSNGWFQTIITDLYESEDVLLKLTSAEIVIQEMVYSPSGLKFVFDRGIYKKFMEDLRGGVFDLTLQLALVRVLSNMIAKVPQSRFDILNDPSLVATIAELLGTSVSDKDYDLKRTTAISGIGCVAATLDAEGMRALATHIPSWLGEYRASLKEGSSENQNLAVLMSLLRILEVPAPSSAVELDLISSQQKSAQALTPSRPVRSPSKEYESQLVTIEEQMTPCILDLLTSKPFTAVRELCYRVMTVFLDSGLRAPLDAFCVRGDLQEMLFSPLYADPLAIKYAKHEFVKSATTHYGEWIKDNTASDLFRDALFWYANASAFDQPPQYKTVGVDVAEEAKD